MTELENKKEALLRRLNSELEQRRIASRYLEEDKRLTVMLTPAGSDGMTHEVFGDIYFESLYEALGHLVILSLGFEIMDVSKLTEGRAVDLLTATSLLNAAIPLGGFGVETVEIPEDAGDEADAAAAEDDGEDEYVEKPMLSLGRLIYTLKLPLVTGMSEDNMYQELSLAFNAMSGILESATGDLYSLAEGNLSPEGFLEKLR